MHLYLSFEGHEIAGEGTDYVGPWQLRGAYLPDQQKCEWTKTYLGKHVVRYSGDFNPNTGIVGTWQIAGLLEGNFHIWPAENTEIQQKYMRLDEEDQGNAIVV